MGDAIIYIHCLDRVLNKYINIMSGFNRQVLGNCMGWLKLIVVSVSRALYRSACIFIRQLFGNIIIAMKERGSRKPNQIFQPSDRRGQQPPPPLVFNPAKQPHRPLAPSQKAPARNSTGELARVEAAPQAVCELLEIYEWRGQTDYPVVRAWWRKVIFNQITFSQSHKQQLVAFLNQNSLRQNAAIYVETEPVRPLSCFRPLPINQFLYAFRESLIAFERLYSLFGAYEVSPRMVAVNADGRVRAWLHPLSHLNNKIEGRHLETADAEASILGDVRQALAEVAQDSPTFRQFFEGALEIRSFIGFLRYIHDFSQNRKIIIASRVVKKQETPANHPRRPLSPLPFRPSSKPPCPIFNPHLSVAPNISPLYTAELALVSRKSVKEPFHFDALETTETLTPLRSKVCTQMGPSSQETSQYGKIVKNRVNLWLVNSKSQEQLPRFSPTPSIEKYLEPSSPNSIEKCMNRLFEDEPPAEKEFGSKLMQLGRSVKASFIQ